MRQGRGQEARVSLADGPGETRFVDNPGQPGVIGAPREARSVGTPEGRP